MSNKLPNRAVDFSGWYNELVVKAGLAEHSPVRGCMIIKPYGYAIWERMQAELDRSFKATGHVNAYFPLFIPKSFLSREAKHVEGFAKECAVVTHYRLKTDADTGELIVDPAAKLEEELIVRPTSETIIWSTYKKWIQSYRDLPLLINQWANVVRWEMRTRLFLRTAEFLWQEGHTAHTTAQEAQAEATQMLGVYKDFIENHMAVPVTEGCKTDTERFAGADITYTVEVLTQEKKALQAGTSHFLGTNFAKAFDVKFADASGQLQPVWGTSWGTTTRLMGALVMMHSDQDGLVLPPKLAPIQIVIVPIYNSEGLLQQITEKVQPFMQQLQQAGLRVKYDTQDNNTPGYKFAQYELQGIPLRLAIGPRDLENSTVEVARRDTKQKVTLPLDPRLTQTLASLLEEIQDNLFKRAAAFREENTHQANSYSEFKEILADKRGFILAHWDGTPETEASIKAETKATIRCIPFNTDKTPGKCMVTGKPSPQRVLFAEAY